MRSMALGEQRAVGDPAAGLPAGRSSRGSWTGRKTEYEAISIALDALKRANTQLQERFSPGAEPAGRGSGWPA